MKLSHRNTCHVCAIVRSKSAAVSPGKPTMKSLEIAIVGRTARSFFTVLLYSSAV